MRWRLERLRWLLVFRCRLRFLFFERMNHWSYGARPRQTVPWVDHHPCLSREAMREAGSPFGEEEVPS